jgi:lambda family phage portal protein
MKLSINTRREAPTALNLQLPSFAELRRAESERQEGQERKMLAARKRSYEAARVNRLNVDWTTINTSTNFEMRRSLRILRARARNLARNNDYIKKFLSMVRTNVAGPSGMKLQVRAKNASGELDQILNRKVEAVWTQWSHKENASANGRLSWRDQQRKFSNTLARDGEVLVRMIVADNPFGFALKFIDVNWLDETYSMLLQNGNRIIMSVEIDANDRAVAYWLSPPASDYQYMENRMRHRTRVPASEIIHCFLTDDENSDDDCQTRGVPWVHTAMARLKILGGYEEAELVAARVGACKMGFFTKPTSEEDAYTGEEEELNGGTPLMDSAQPGQFGVLDEGWGLESYDPTHPNTSYGAFIKAVLRGIASGLDVSYFTLANDLEGVNYGSARIGLIEERDNWRALQNFQIEHFNRVVFLNWLKSAVMTGALDIRAADFVRLSEPQFQARGWKWIDPQKEITAKILSIDHGLETRTDTIAEQGGDFEETVLTLQREEMFAELMGVKLRPEPKPAAASTGSKEQKEEEEEDDE